jgi:hypothetical protein
MQKVLVKSKKLIIAAKSLHYPNANAKRACPKLRQNWDNANISILKLAEVGGIRPNGKAEETAHRGARNARRGSIKCLWEVKAKGRNSVVGFTTCL